jgi:maltokinase
VALIDDLAGKVAPLLVDFLPRQRWFSGDQPPVELRVTVIEQRDGEPLMAWLLLDVTTADGTDAIYQLVLGGRSAASRHRFLRGKDMIGEVEGTVFYDALVDPELAMVVLEAVAPDDPAKVARPLLVEQSNTSVVYDERLILKMFRRVHSEPNPDIEVTAALNERGFPHAIPQIAALRHDGADLAVVREYLLGATDAWELAHTSLRDLLGTPVPPQEAGGDFAPEAATLGEVTARLHLALADIYGSEPAAPDAWRDGFQAQLDRLRGAAAAPADAQGRVRLRAADVVDVEGVSAALDDLLDVGEPGLDIRGHGDLHLGQMLLGDSGWHVIDFEGEPARPVSERLVPSSPLRDVAGMVRSFHYAARTALAERGRDIDAELVGVADAWESRAVEAYWRGYTSVDGVDVLLPPDAGDRDKLLRAFELDKAVYEVVYELGHRPDWVDVPASAIRRTLALVA